MHLSSKIKAILELSKVKITIAVSFTTFTGYILAKHNIDIGLLWVISGIFLLACGASVINHVQEVGTDLRMVRTRKRPIPSGRITTKGALILASVQIITGILILWFGSGFLALLLGLIALVWYNLIYTPLKKITPNAVIPGSIIGAIPPLAGWVAAGGSLIDAQAWAMAFFFFVWQVPHFYLLVLKYGKQYEEAGFPSLTMFYSERHIKIIIFLWILATCLAALLLPYFGLITSVYSITALLISIVWIAISFLKPIVNQSRNFLPFRYFMKINYFVLFIILLLTIDNLIL